MRKLLILFILIGTTVSAQWAQGKGSAYIKLGTWNQVSEKTYDITGEIRDIGRRTYFIPGVYARFGLSDKWTVTGYVPYVRTTQDFQGVDVGSSIGDVTLAIERQFYKKKFVAAWDVTLGLPTGDVHPNIGTGDGEFNVLGRLLIGSGYKIGKQAFYIKGNVGYNIRSKGLINQYQAGVETGSTFGKLFLLTRLNTIQTVTEISADNFAHNGGGIFGDFERTSLGVEATYNINKNWGVSAGYSEFLAGKLIFNEPSYTYGIIYKY